ncbi:MAG: rod shape-determining protein RodA [Candidatus Sungiibacteriota bacterium]|uniref:Probable peptidoglycan glycosyltransferase FtsW n=1 Tax=Candidatus Sungiibacteriota bacterium TaxID=2750080 RepID=A0A7T5RKI8_9BACT|nr:MAG: rod shape-determining protein RodA [Candidatus Sungbacteria bacterium]
MRSILAHVSRFDWLLQGAVFLLTGLGILSLFSLSGVSPLPYFERQLLWAGVGIVLLLAASSIDFRLFRTQSFAVFIFYVLTVVLLVAVLTASFKIRGVDAWLKFGNVLFQPVELVKLALVILFAKFFSKRHIEIYRVEHLLVSGLYLIIPTSLVLLQPDLGSAVVLISIWVAIVVFSGMKLRHFFALLLIAALIIGGAWLGALKPYQKTRITSFFDPYADSRGAGYQVLQSMIAVGSGQLRGKGLGYGSQTHLHFLPEAETDFIFAAFAEEWGFVGTIFMLLLFLIVIWRVVRIGMNASDNFSRLYTLGFAALIFTQSFIHIGMNMGALPITGITLPFVSYGGSSLVTLLAGVGILQNIKINSRREIE